MSKSDDVKADDGSGDWFKVRDALHSQQLDWIDWRAEDVSLIGIPGFHIGGLWWAMQGFAAGITNVAMRMFVSGDAVTLIRRRAMQRRRSASK